MRLYHAGQWTTLVDSTKYAPFGDAESWKLGNGLKINIGLDSAYRLDSISTTPDSVARATYAYNAVRDITSITDHLDTMANRSFTYDDTYRLTTARSREYPDTLQRYIYARNGNRDTVISYNSAGTDTARYTYSDNKLTQVSGANGASFTYNALGSITQEIRGVDTLAFQYNKAEMLTSVNNGVMGTYSYDAWYRRIKKVTAGGTTTKYIPTGSGQLLTEYGVTGGWNRDYVYLNGQLVARFSSVAGEGVQYVINDHLGTPIALVDSAKTVRWKAKWYPFGEIYSETISATNDVRFPGQLRDDETGLYYNWHRYYDPSTGRYSQADPIGLDGGDYNLYRYAGGNSTRNADPFGLFSTDDVLSNVPTLPHWFVDASAGFGDVLLMGFGNELRYLIGADGVVNPCSDAYKRGKKLGLAIDLLTGMKGGIIKAGTKTVTTEFSHWIPTRILKKLFGRDIKNIFNGNYIEPMRHFKNDPYRYLKGLGKDDKPWKTYRMILDRTPRVYVGTGLGFGYGYVGYNGN